MGYRYHTVNELTIEHQTRTLSVIEDKEEYSPLGRTDLC